MHLFASGRGENYIEIQFFLLLVAGLVEFTNPAKSAR
jgi:hypothetical protein